MEKKIVSKLRRDYSYTSRKFCGFDLFSPCSIRKIELCIWFPPVVSNVVFPLRSDFCFISVGEHGLICLVCMFYMSVASVLIFGASSWEWLLSG